MAIMEFTKDDYLQKGIVFPKTYQIMKYIDKIRYAEMENEYDADGNGVSNTFGMLKKRTSFEYYSQILTAQTDALDYAQLVFPTYKFVMPEALMDDWLAIMDPHREGKRDHSLHQPMTAYIVSELLGSGTPDKSLLVNGKYLLDICADFVSDDNNQQTNYLRHFFKELYPSFHTKRLSEPIKHKIACEVFYQTAVISALYHDIGYPWQFANGLSKSLFASDYLDKRKIYRSADEIKERISGRLLYFPFHGYSESSIKHNTFNWQDRLNTSIVEAFHDTHGFPGALAFTYLTDIVRQYPKELTFDEAICQFIIDWAAVGILMHDMPRQCRGDKKNPPKPQFRLNFNVDPLSCIIAMSDILEEFNRPRSEFKSTASDVNVGYVFPCIGTNVEVIGGELHITYIYKSDAEVSSNRKRRMDEVNEYFNNSDKYINLGPLGINKVVCHVDKFLQSGNP